MRGFMLEKISDLHDEMFEAVYRQRWRRVCSFSVLFSNCFFNVLLSVV